MYRVYDNYSYVLNCIHIIFGLRSTIVTSANADLS